MKRAMLVAALVVLTALAMPTLAGQRYQIDADHGLATDNAIQSYDEDGVARANVTTPRLSLTVAEEAAACGVEASLVSDARNDYLCLHYRGDIEQTTRLHIPDDYWHPYVREEKEPIADGPTASFRPTASANYTSVEVTFDGSANAVYAIPEDVSASYALINRVNERTRSIFGVELWDKGTEWQVVNASAFGDEASIRLQTIPERTLVEYDADPGPSESWVPVPEGESATAPVYYFERTSVGENGSVHVVSTTSDAPDIRYRVRGTGPGSTLDAAVEQLQTADDQLDAMLDSALPDWLGGDNSEGAA